MDLIKSTAEIITASGKRVLTLVSVLDSLYFRQLRAKKSDLSIFAEK